MPHRVRAASKGCSPSLEKDQIRKETGSRISIIEEEEDAIVAQIEVQVIIAKYLWSLQVISRFGDIINTRSREIFTHLHR